MRAYLVPDAWFIVLRDQDTAQCKSVKSKLKKICNQAMKNNVLIRIACRELESWYLADLHAVEKALGISNIAKHQNKAKYRNPDLLHAPSEELERITKNKYQKVLGSRKMGLHLDLDNKRSNSFRVFIDGLRKIIDISST